MSCILTIAGESFDVDSVVSISGILPYKTFYKGDPKLKTKPHSAKLERSGCSIKASEAEFNNFSQQVEDSIDYLRENQEGLQLVKSIPTIDFAVLDFGVGYEDTKFVQSHHFNLDLLKLVADLNISIEISVYQSAE